MAHNEAVDVVLVGAGIMSATLAVLLKELDPGMSLEVVEQMDSGAAESSNPWNNAGTGHAGLCELNYTPQAADGSIDIKKRCISMHSSKSRNSFGPIWRNKGRSVRANPSLAQCLT